MRFAVHLPAAVLAIAVAMAGCGDSGGGDDAVRGSEADALKALSVHADELARDDELSGAVLVTKDGRVLFRRAYGLADRKRRVPNTLRTAFASGR
jgi:CubicO group peptidase (beta-lactamase class C family)